MCADLEEKIVEANALAEALQTQKDELESKLKAAEKKSYVASWPVGWLLAS